MPLSATPDISALEKLTELTPELALQPATRFLSRLIEDPEFRKLEILPFLREAQGAREWYVARRHNAPDGSYSLQVFVWPPGTGTRIHDHSSWGVYHCVVGSVLEERYKRLDDGSITEHARLRKIWQLMWSPEDGCSTVLPGDGGIHRVTNLGEEVAVSVHLYGPRLGKIDGRDYDPSRDYVCDRSED
jgi:hypothetical protein